MTSAALSGMLLIRKPRGMTSHDVVEVIRRKLGTRRVGHTGTLDPMAEGLLILLVGSATKSQQAFQGHDKAYEATLQLGAQTDTGDATGRVIRTAPVPPLDRRRVEDLLASFQGSMSQTPPAYSAVKVQGHPAYWWARRHQPVELSARTVRVLGMELLECAAERITFRVRCSAGTYVRTLAESIAESLGTVGHLASLTRTSVGQWRLEEAKPLSWAAEADPDLLARTLQPLPSSV